MNTKNSSVNTGTTLAEIQIFENSEFGKVRTTIINNEPYFVGIDIANILEYQNGSRDINRHVDKEDRKTVSIFDGKQNRNQIVINESGLYSLVLGSKLPSAKKFKHWVTSEVLPTIRRTGSFNTTEYVTRGEFEAILSGLATTLTSSITTAIVQALPAIQKNANPEQPKVININEEVVEYFTIIGYCNIKKIHLDKGQQISFSHKAKKLSEEMGYEVRSVPDSKWGKMNTYHVNVLDELFDM